MDRTVTVVLAGVVGWGRVIVGQFLDGARDLDVRLVGAIARRPERCERLRELLDAGAKVYPDLESFYAEGNRCDLVVVSTPMHVHRQQTVLALEHGSHVFCEKPIAATVQDALAMRDAERASGRTVAIGYQWSFSSAIQALKRDVLDGVLGRPIRLKTYVSWNRSRSYYAGRGWAGAVKSEDGAWVLDSPVSNATAHFLHNALYVIGDSVETSARPADVQAELYRANAIDNFDTAALRCRTTSGVEVTFYTSHAVPSSIGPAITYEFEKGTVFYSMGATNTFTARMADGSFKVYGDPDEGRDRKIRLTVDAIRNGQRPVCGIEAALSQLTVANGAQDAMPEIAAFPASAIRTDGNAADPLTYVEGLQAVLLQGFDQGLLPSELGSVPWARAGARIDLTDYRYYPGGTPRP